MGDTSAAHVLAMVPKLKRIDVAAFEVLAAKVKVFLDLKEISQVCCFFLPVKDRVATVREKSGDFVLKSVKSQRNLF